jgi:hypothetical protein
VFPPGRHSDELEAVADNIYHLNSQEKFAKSQLPEQITKKDGFVLRRPRRSISVGHEWRYQSERLSFSCSIFFERFQTFR